MEILLINLMRLGDLVQTLPVIRGLKARYPEARLTLLVMDLFGEAARLLPGIHRLLPFPGTALAPVLDREGWPAAVDGLDRWLKENLRPAPDLAINLTPTLLGGLLARLSQAPRLRGLWVSDSRELVTAPGWASYSLVVSKARQANPFNVADLFVLGAGLRPDGQGVALAADQEAGSPTHPRVPPGTRVIGLCPGASRPERQWPPERFAQMARLLLPEGPAHFVILGSAGERPLGEAILRALPAGTGTLLAGETSLPDLRRRLAALDLLITNDTGPMHLAAAVGIRVLALFLASARVRDTGPAGRGHVALEPHLPCHPCLRPCPRPRCHEALPPEVVAAVAREMLAGREPAPREAPPGWETVRMYATQMDPGGCLAALPVLRRPLSREEFWLWVHRLAWEKFFSPAPPPGLEEWLRDLLQERYLPPADDLGLPRSLAALWELGTLARRGEETAARLARMALEADQPPLRLSMALSTLTAVDQGLRRLAAQFPELAAVVEFFFQDQRLLRDRDPAGLARELSRAYRRLWRLAEVCEAAAVHLAPGALPLPFYLAQVMHLKPPAARCGSAEAR